MIIPAMSPQAAFIFGIVLLIIGASFFWKGWIATVKGQMLYWQGFLPFTIVSPFLIHWPPGKNSLFKNAQGLWIHLIVAPVFFILAVLFSCAGADFVNLPGVTTLNMIMNGGKAGSDWVTFNKRTGYQFPFWPRTSKVLARLCGQKVDLQEKDRLLHDEMHQDQ